MSFDNFLNQTCAIERPTASGTDRYNANAYTDESVAEDVRCRLIHKSVKLLDPKSSEYTWVKALVLLLPTGTDIVAKDKVTVGGVVYEVKEHLPRKRTSAEHHVSCVVEALNA